MIVTQKDKIFTTIDGYIDLYESQKVPTENNRAGTVKSPTMIMTSVDPIEAEKKRMATLNLDTISSEADSHMTSHFIGDSNRRPILN